MQVRRILNMKISAGLEESKINGKYVDLSLDLTVMSDYWFKKNNLSVT